MELKIKLTRNGEKLYNAVKIIRSLHHIESNIHTLIWELFFFEFETYKQCQKLPIGLDYVVIDSGFTIENSYCHRELWVVETLFTLAKSDNTEPYTDCFSPRELRILARRNNFNEALYNHVFEKRSARIFPWWYMSEEDKKVAQEDDYENRVVPQKLFGHYKKYIEFVTPLERKGVN